MAATFKIPADIHPALLDLYMRLDAIGRLIDMASLQVGELPLDTERRPLSDEDREGAVALHHGALSLLADAKRRYGEIFDYCKRAEGQS